MSADESSSLADHFLAHGDLYCGRGKVAIWRRWIAGLGVLALLALALFGKIGGGQVLAGLALVALTIGTVLAWVELSQITRWRRRQQRVVPAEGREPFDLVAHPPNARRWQPLLAVCLTTAIVASAVQTWYTSGTAIAGGDIAPPNGTAWLGRLFSSWTWSGSDLGRVGGSETQLPWAGLLWIVHNAGGSSALAQRIWYSLLFTGAALGTLWLLRSLHASWAAATVGSLLYVFNPFVLSTVGTNPVFMAALLLVVVEPAIILAVCSGRWGYRSGCVAIVGTVPLIGYAYENPPLVLAVGAAALAAFLVAGVWLGRSARRRGLALFSFALPLAACASLYWVIPSFEQLQFVATQHLSSLSSWTWTESRSTLANAFWLNTSWAWPFREYVPYSGDYATFPLATLRYAFPIIAFAALSFRYDLSLKSVRQMTLVASGAGGSLFLIFLSTGTLSPGSLLFDPIYRLPFGWLLQDPGRFLLLAGVAYAAMAIVTLDTCMNYFECAAALEQGWSSTKLSGTKAGFAVLVVGIAALAPGYPLAFGSIAPGARPGNMPSSHVRVPRYWADLASYLNGPTAPPGNVLVLPPDPFYQMLYSWGYYGNDGFVTDMIRRNVVDPAGQGYGATGQALLGAVDEVASSLLAGDDTAANRILRALQTPDVLVRGDIVTHGLVASQDSPKALAVALQADASVELVHQSGPLSLYRLRSRTHSVGGTQTGVQYVTSQSATPNLLALPALPAGTAIIRHVPITGVPALVQVPPEASWTLRGNLLQDVVALPTGRSYTVTQLGPMGDVSTGASSQVGSVHVTVRATSAGTFAELSATLGVNEVADGSFASGTWGKVGNCDAIPGTYPDLHASLGQGPLLHSGRALVLSANADIACEASSVLWHGGPIMLDVTARRIAGRRPSVCLWEIGPERCANLPALDASRQWRTYQQTVTPPPGTKGLDLFLYADGGTGGGQSVAAYTAVSVRSLTASAPLDIIATATSGNYQLPVLTVANSTFSTVWSVSGHAQHVLVDGMMNGWLRDTSQPLVPHDNTTWILTAGFAATLTAAAATLLLGGSAVLDKLWPRRNRHVRSPK